MDRMGKPSGDEEKMWRPVFICPRVAREGDHAQHGGRASSTRPVREKETDARRDNFSAPEVLVDSEFATNAAPRNDGMRETFGARGHFA
jgi:hypothetical protein